MAQAYCVKCKKKLRSDPKQVTLKNKRSCHPRCLPEVQNQGIPHRKG